MAQAMGRERRVKISPGGAKEYSGGCSLKPGRVAHSKPGFGLSGAANLLSKGGRAALQRRVTATKELRLQPRCSPRVHSKGGGSWIANDVAPGGIPPGLRVKRAIKIHSSRRHGPKVHASSRSLGSPTGKDTSSAVELALSDTEHSEVESKDATNPAEPVRL